MAGGYYITCDSATSSSTTSSTVWSVWTSSSDSTSATSSTVWERWTTSASTATVVTHRWPEPTQEEIERREQEKLERQERRERARQERAEAQKRAEILLRESINKEQRKQFDNFRYFIVKSKSGKLFRIKHGWQGNVEEIDEAENVIAEYCIHPRQKVPLRS